LGVDDDDEVTAGLVRGVGGLVLALEHGGDLRRETTDPLTGCVDDHPVVAGVFRKVSLHLVTSFSNLALVVRPGAERGFRLVRSRGGPAGGGTAAVVRLVVLNWELTLRGVLPSCDTFVPWLDDRGDVIAA